MLYIAIGLSWATALIELLTQQRTVVWLPYLVIAPIILVIPRTLYILSFKKRVTESWLKTIETWSLIVILINAPGSLILHDMGVQYDRFLHFAAALAMMVIFYLLLMPLSRYPLRNGPLLSVIFMIMFGGLFIWEGIQFSIDRVFGTQLFHDAVQHINLDFTEDIIFGLIGLLFALVYLSRNSEKINSMRKDVRL